MRRFYPLAPVELNLTAAAVRHAVNNRLFRDHGVIIELQDLADSLEVKAKEFAGYTTLTTDFSFHEIDLLRMALNRATQMYRKDIEFLLSQDGAEFKCRRINRIIEALGDIREALKQPMD